MDKKLNLIIKMKSKFLNLFKTSELNEFHIEKLKFIDNTDFSKVKEKVKKELSNPTDEFLEDGILNLKVYYALPLLDPLNPHAISKNLDPFWHFHVLFTKDYIKFCNKLIGKYMHHEPLIESNIEDKKRIKKLYDYTVKVNGILLKKVDKQWWPLPENDDDTMLVCSHGDFKPKTKNKLLSKVIQNSLFTKNINLT